MKFLSIDGNIGAGKTTLLENLAREVAVRFSDKKIKILFEPVERFESYKSFNPLQLFYEDKTKNAAFVQLHIIGEIAEYFREAITEDEGTIDLIVCERSLFSPKIFSGLMLKNQLVTDFEYEKLCDETNRLLHDVLPDCAVLGADYVFYLDTPDEVCQARIEKRARQSEVNKISLDYLSDLRTEYSYYLERFGQVNGLGSVMRSTSTGVEETTVELLDFIRRVL